MGSLNVRYDEKGDFLEVYSEKKKGYFKELEDGIFERVDEDGNTIGFAILNMKRRDKREISIPLEPYFGEKEEV